MRLPPFPFGKPRNDRLFPKFEIATPALGGLAFIGYLKIRL